jgi:hypothetical protein
MRVLNNIAFFWVGQDVSIPTLLCRSIRSAFGPDFNVYQLSDPLTPKVEGVTHHKKMKLSPHIMVARLEAYSALDITEPTLFLDADMLVLCPFDLPPLAENEVGVTVRGKRDTYLLSTQHLEQYPEFANKDTAQVMPYIFSFVYVRSQLLFLRQLIALRKLPKRYHRWYGDQITLKNEIDASSRFTARDFDIDVYNRTVRSHWEFAEVLASPQPVFLAHFKGPESKSAMFEALSMIGANA